MPFDLARRRLSWRCFPKLTFRLSHQSLRIARLHAPARKDPTRQRVIKDRGTLWTENVGIRVARFPGEQCGDHRDMTGTHRRQRELSGRFDPTSQINSGPGVCTALNRLRRQLARFWKVLSTIKRPSHPPARRLTILTRTLSILSF